MRRFKKFWFVLLVPAFLGAPAAAEAQFATFGGGYFGSRGGFGGNFGYGNYGYVGGFGSIGGYGNMGYGPNWSPGFAGYGNIGYGANWAPGFGGMAGTPYGPGLRSPFNGTGMVLTPGFGPTETARMRPTLYPAIPEPPRAIIAVALEADEKDRARIEIRVPTANARVYLDGVLTKQTGLDRMYKTPKLNPSSRYFFNVEVVWQDDTGTNRTLRREINLRAGDSPVLNLRDD